MFIFSFFIISKYNYKNKLSSYECGFTPIHYPIQPYSIKFFGVGILFLFFDIELIYLIPYSFNNLILNKNSNIIFLFFFLVVIFGLIYEWYNLILEW